MKKIAPGVFPQFLEQVLRPPTAVENDIRAGVPVHQSMASRPKEWIPYLARMFLEDEDTVNAEWPSLVRDAEVAAKAFETLQKTLTARDWNVFTRHWSSIVSTRYRLCAVVR